MVVGLFDEKFANKFDARVDITIQFVDKILGGLPQSGKPWEYFVKMKQMSDQEAISLEQRIKDGLISSQEKQEIEDTNCCVFERDKDGFLCIWQSNIKAMMREIFSTTGVFMKKKAKSGKNVFQHRTWVDPIRPKFLIESGGKWVPTDRPSGYLEKVKIIKDMSGQRTALGRHEYLKDARLSFSWCFGDDNGAYLVEDIEYAWYKAQTNGLGASRSQGHGMFKIVEFEWVNKPGVKKIRKENT